MLTVGQYRHSDSTTISPLLWRRPGPRFGEARCTGHHASTGNELYVSCRDLPWGGGKEQSHYAVTGVHCPARREGPEQQGCPERQRRAQKHRECHKEGAWPEFLRPFSMLEAKKKKPRRCLEDKWCSYMSALPTATACNGD